MLEVILGLLILVIAVLAVVLFGLITANMQHVAQAARQGAKLAAETPANGLDTQAETDTVRNAVQALAVEILGASGVGTTDVEVALQHTVGPTDFMSRTNASCPFVTAPPLPDDSVRVTVCVPVSNLAPDLLSTFGFSIQGRTAEFTVTMAHQ